MCVNVIVNMDLNPFHSYSSITTVSTLLLTNCTEIKKGDFLSELDSSPPDRYTDNSPGGKLPGGKFAARGACAPKITVLLVATMFIYRKTTVIFYQK